MESTLPHPTKSYLPLKALGLAIVFSITGLLLFNTLDLAGSQTTGLAPFYDAQIKATVLDIKINEANELYKGSILDYKGYLVSYRYVIDGKTFSNTEFIKSRQEDKIVKIQSMIKNAANTVWVQIDSKNPKVSQIDFGTSMVSS